MNKRFICALLCSAMIFTETLSVFAAGNSDSNALADAGFSMTVDGEDKSYGNIVDAICSVETGEEAEIKLTKDVSIKGTKKVVLSAGTLTVDLNGHVLSVDSADVISSSTNRKGYIQVKGSDARLIIKDTSEGAKGKLKTSLKGEEFTYNTLGLINVCNHAALDFLSGTIEAETGITGEEADEIYVSGKIAADCIGINCMESNLEIRDTDISVANTKNANKNIVHAVDFFGGNFCDNGNLIIKNSNITCRSDFNYNSCYALSAGGGADAYSFKHLIEDTSFKVDARNGANATAIQIGFAPETLIMKNVDIDTVVSEERATNGVVVTLGKKTTLSANSIDVRVESKGSVVGWDIGPAYIGDYGLSNAIINDIDVKAIGGNSSSGIKGAGHYTNAKSSVKVSRGWAYAYEAANFGLAEGKTSFENSSFKSVSTQKKDFYDYHRTYGGYISEHYNANEVVLKNNCSFYAKGGKEQAAFTVLGDNAERLRLADGCHWADAGNSRIDDPSKAAYALVTDGSAVPVVPSDDDGEDAVPVSISKKCSFSWAETETSRAPKIYYDGTAKEPAVIIKKKADKSVLTEGEDYTVTYAPKSRRSTITTDQAGAFKVVIEGRGKYTGKITKYYNVKKLSLKDAYNDGEGALTYSVVSGNSLIFDPNGVKPEITVSFNGIKINEEDFGKCFKVSYARNKAVRAADHRKAPVVVLKGRGNFTGTLAIPFAINKCAIDSDEITATQADAAYSSRPGAFMKKPVLKYGRKKLKLGRDYTIEGYQVRQGAEGEAEFVDADRSFAPESGSLVRVIIKGKGNYDETTTRIVEYSVR